MTEYRRNRIPGGRFFFTVNLADRQTSLLIDHIDGLRSSFRQVRNDHPFQIDAIVVLPDHLHTIWTLPEGDSDYALRWRLIKARFSRYCPADALRSPSQVAKGERAIWQRRYWEHTIRNDRDFTVHMDYIHFNPVKHGHVRRVCDWPYSSFAQMVRRNIYPLDWAGAAITEVGRFGEPH